MSVVIKPIVTEKMTTLGEKLNRYGFFVDRRANKIEIKKAVEELYGVTVTDVNTLVVTPKIKSRYTRSGLLEGRAPIYKKAIVTLAEGDKIDFYSNI
ncbi:MAG: 50S ribosomal protein L23 [Paludibacteraceae bacterium]|nr:50S ribosomal protein L23 [Paludibacteraceae bacterium]MBR1785851.1 50S ribosomal protein L23 [Paludibacteraceae bacterium]